MVTSQQRHFVSCCLWQLVAVHCTSPARGQHLQLVPTRGAAAAGTAAVILGQKQGLNQIQTHRGQLVFSKDSTLFIPQDNAPQIKQYQKIGTKIVTICTGLASYQHREQ